MKTMSGIWLNYSSLFSRSILKFTSQTLAQVHVLWENKNHSAFTAIEFRNAKDSKNVVQERIHARILSLMVKVGKYISQKYFSNLKRHTKRGSFFLEVEIKVEAVTKTSVVIKWQKSNITNAVYIIQLRELNSRTIYYKEKDWFAWEQILQVNYTWNPENNYFIFKMNSKRISCTFVNANYCFILRLLK